MQYLGVGVIREDVEESPGSTPAALIAPQLHGVLYYASLAPSGHNAQPWTVRVVDREIWIGTDRARWLPKIDPANRELMLSIGTFLENLITAAPAYGFAAVEEVIGAGGRAADREHFRKALEDLLALLDPNSESRHGVRHTVNIYGYRRDVLEPELAQRQLEHRR